MINKIYPNLDPPYRKLIISSLLASFEYILEVGMDGMCEEILEENLDISAYPTIQRCLEEYKQSKSTSVI